MQYAIRSTINPKFTFTAKPLRVVKTVVVNDKPRHYLAADDVVYSQLHMLVDISHKSFYVCNGLLHCEADDTYVQIMNKPVSIDKHYLNVPGKYSMIDCIRSQVDIEDRVKTYIKDLKVTGLTLCYVADYETRNVGIDISEDNRFSSVGGGIFQNTIYITGDMYPEEAKFIHSIDNFKIGVVTMFNEHTQKLCTFIKYMYNKTHRFSDPAAVDRVVIDMTLSDELVEYDTSTRKQLIDEQTLEFPFIVCTEVHSVE